MASKLLTIPSNVDLAFSALASNENGAAHAALVTFSNLLLGGEAIDPDFQKVVNALFVRSFFLEQLPPKKKGRPKNRQWNEGHKVATLYLNLKDAGVKYGEAVAQVAATFHKDERNVMRLVKEYRHLVGDTKQQREATREWLRFLASMTSAEATAYRELASEAILKVLARTEANAAERNLIVELDSMIQEVLNRRVSTDTK